MASSESEFTRIDIDQLLKTHKPALHRWLPKFILRKMEKLIHLQFVNDFLSEHYHDSPGEFLDAVVAWLGIEVNYINRAVLDDNLDKRPIVVANHPLGGSESVLLMHAIYKQYGAVKMITQPLLYAIKPLVPLWVNIPGKNDRARTDAFIEAFDGDEPLLIFPAGYCSRKLSFGEVFDYAWFKTFVKMARTHKRPIVPVHVGGQNSKRFYRYSKLRKALGIKNSLETVLLVDEMFRKRGSQLDITIGQLLPGDTFDKAVDDAEWTARLRQYVYRLGKDPAATFDPHESATLPLT